MGCSTVACTYTLLLTQCKSRGAEGWGGRRRGERDRSRCRCCCLSDVYQQGSTGGVVHRFSKQNKKKNNDFRAGERWVVHTEKSWLWRELPGGSPPPPFLEEEGRSSISTQSSSIVGIQGSSERRTNPGWDMKLWMEFLDSGFSRPSYRELRNAFTTLICSEELGDRKTRN